MVKFVPKFTDILSKTLSYYNKDLNDQNKKDAAKMIIGVV